MASLDHGRFRPELSRLLQAHPGDAKRFLARSALMWLSVAQRPLLAHELWIAMQVEESKDIEHVERLLTDPAYVDGPKAASSLRHLLGGLVALTADPLDPSRIRVALSDPELRTYLGHLDDPTAPDGGDALLPLGFTTPQAHIVVASVCMIVCSVTALHLAHAHDARRASSLMLYAWSHWDTHLSLSGVTFANDNAAGLTDSMVFRVCTDVLVLLCSLSDFVTGPITFPSDRDRLECEAGIIEVQKALERPVLLLSALVKHEGYAATLQGARRLFEASRASQTKAPTPPAADERGSTEKVDGSGRLPLEDSRILLGRPRTGTRVETLSIDRALATTEAVFGEPERQLVHAFAEVARSLRLLSVALVSPALYRQLLGQYGGGAWSPLDILVNSANWMEAMASYPYWQEVASGPSHNPLLITDTADVNYHAAKLVLQRVSAAAPAQPADGAASAGAPAPRRLQADISPARWRAATVVYKLAGLRAAPGPTFTVNDIQALSRRQSSFALVSPEMHSTGDLRYLSPLIPTALRRFCRKRLTPLVSRFGSSDSAQQLEGFCSGAFTSGAPDSWPRIKVAILSDGYRFAAFYACVAVLLNHVRRTLVPWLGTYMYPHPVEDLRLALDRPDVFLEQALSFPWSHAIAYFLQISAWEIAGTAARDLLALNNGDLPVEVQEAARARGAEAAGVRAMLERVMQGTKVLYLIWGLSILDYIFARGTNTVTFAIAFAKLLSGGEREHIALGAVLKAHWTRLPFVAYQLYLYARSAMWPMAAGAVANALLGRPGLLALVAAAVLGVYASLRLRSRLIVALELSGLFVALGLAAAAAGLLAAEFLADPAGLRAASASAARAAARARAALPRGAGARAGILGGRGALPVRRPAAAVAEREREAEREGGRPGEDETRAARDDTRAGGDEKRAEAEAVGEEAALCV